MPDLFTPCRLAGAELQHRVVLAPLTRMRASEPSLAPRAMSVEYYAQRATKGGLLISEATNITPEGFGEVSTPGVWNAHQVAEWRKVTDAVHAKGAKFFCQLWHVGRVSHPSFAEHPASTSSGLSLPSVSSSAVAIKGNKRTYGGKVKHEMPRGLRTDEIPRLIEDYVRAARNACEAGFDGVELHAAHGYLVDQFLNDSVNKRTDRYGGSVHNRVRLLHEIVSALVAELGAGRVAVRMSPTTKDSLKYQQCTDTDPELLYSTAIEGLNRFPLAYLLLSEPRWDGRSPSPEQEKGFSLPLVNGPLYRGVYKGTLIGCGGFTPADARRAVEEGVYDMIAFGRWFISNPDLPERLRTGAPLNVYERKTFYSYHEEGLIDYPDVGGSVGVAGKYRLMPQHSIGLNLKQAKL